MISSLRLLANLERFRPSIVAVGLRVMIPLERQLIPSLHVHVPRDSYNAVLEDLNPIEKVAVPRLLTLHAMADDFRSLRGLLFGGDRTYALRPSPWSTPLTQTPHTVA